MKKKMTILHWKCLLMFFMLLSAYGVESFIGLNWGRFATQNLVPSMVVDLLLQNEIPHLRIYGPSPPILVAFENSPISIVVTLMKDFLIRNKWTNLKTIDDFLENLIIPPIKRGVNITDMIIVHEPFSKARPMVKNMTAIYKVTRQALDKHNLTYIRTTTSHLTDVITMTAKPSEADFRPDIKAAMIDLLTEINSTNSYFTLNIFPITSLLQRHWPIEFGFMDNASNFTVNDNDYIYTNIFEFLYDSLVVALEKAGFPNMEIQIGQIGWPTDGGKACTAATAERFYRGFIPHIINNRGSPRRRNRTINVYLNSLSDENRNLVDFGEYNRHFGIYNYDGSPKFPIDFSGQTRRIYPAEAKGTVKMPSRWCIFNGDTKNKSKVDYQFEFACNSTDCSDLSAGSSCETLDYESRVSYAFNAYYQSLSQQFPMACDFGGLGVLSPVDPSAGKCRFPVGILTAEAVDGGTQVPATVFNYALMNAISSGCDDPPLKLSLKLSLALPLCVLLFFLLISHNEIHHLLYFFFFI